MRHLLNNFIPDATAHRLRGLALNSKTTCNTSISVSAEDNQANFNNVLLSEKIASPSIADRLETRLTMEPCLSLYSLVSFPYAWSYLIYSKDSYHDWHIDAYDSLTPSPDYERIAYTSIVCLTPKLDNQARRFEFQHGATHTMGLGDCLVFDGSSMFNAHKVNTDVSGTMVFLTNYAYYK